MIQTSLFISVLLLFGSAWGESSSERYQNLTCDTGVVDLQKSIETTLLTEKESLARRLALQGLKGEKLSTIEDISVDCVNTSKKYFEQSDRYIISAYTKVKSNICRLQFSTQNMGTEKMVFDFEYIRCVTNHQ